MKPNIKRIINRSLVLACVVGRGFLEGKDDLTGRENARKEIVNWLHGENLEDEAEIEELNLLNTPIGELQTQKAIDATWKCEGISVLLWSLGLNVINDIHEQVNDPRNLVESIGFMDSDKVKSNRISCKMISECEIDRYAEYILNVHWRLRDFKHRGNKYYNCINLFRNEINDPIINTCKIDLIDGDLGISGSKISVVDANLLQNCFSIVQERHRAANWLIGDHELYSEISCDT